MYKLSASSGALLSVCWRCELQGASTVRHFCVSNRNDAEGAQPHAPRTRTERSQDSFRQISQLPRSSQGPPRQSSSTSSTGSYSLRGRGGLSDAGTRSAFPVSNDTQRAFTPSGRGGTFTRGGFSSRGGRGRGGPSRGGRGGRGGAARGRGRGRGANQQARGRRGNAEDDFEDDPRILELVEAPTNYEIMAEKDSHAFASSHEMLHYAQVVDLVDHFYETQEKADQMEKQPGKFPAGQIQKMRGMHDEMIADAMVHVMQTDEMAIPRHLPQESTTAAAAVGEVGDVPVSGQGMANIVETDLRYLAKREGNEWQDPKELAAKLVAGDFVKFRNLPEKREVLRLAEDMGYQEGQELGTKNIGFESPSEEARKDIIGRIVSGRYNDPSDAQIKDKFGQNIARLISGNATYPPESKQMLMKTIRELMPEVEVQRERPARR